MDDDVTIAMQSIDNALSFLSRERDEWKDAAESMRLQLAYARELLDDKNDALDAIATWAEAYPLEMFPDPDFEVCAQLLKAGGQTLDSISASVVRQALRVIGNIAREALKRTGEKTPEET